MSNVTMLFSLFLFIQNMIGIIMFDKYNIMKNDQPKYPNALEANAYCSYIFPEYQAMNRSTNKYILYLVRRK